MECRPFCAACCIAPSISSPLPGMPHGKPAGVPCVNLDRETLRCTIWETAVYPPVCRNFRPSLENCGNSREEALRILAKLEEATRPERP